jgi:ferritin-like metal-binding protein YciE
MTMSMNSLKDVYVDQLQDIHSANQQALEVSRKLADAVKNDDLKDAIKAGCAAMEHALSTVSTMIEGHNADPKGEHCKGMEGIANEARAHGLEASFGDDDARDAMIIAQYQRIAHYAIAGYGCCLAFAKRLDQDDDGKKLHSLLDTAYKGDRRMTEIAEGQVNKAAA